MADKTYSVLFLCTGNSARSILAEAILNHDGKGRFRAYSAGSRPRGEVNPHALALLRHSRFDVSELRSKSWDEFARAGAPVMDFVFTVCDDAAGEMCPVWPGQPITAHWGIADPVAVDGADWERERAFVMALRYMKQRIAAFTALPLASLERVSLTAKLREIGHAEGASSPRPNV